MENSDVGLNKTLLLNEITNLTNEFVSILDKKSIKINKKKLLDVAAISANNDKELGKIIAKKALAQKIEKVVFDRGGYKYHGRIKAIAEGAREGGLNF